MARRHETDDEAYDRSVVEYLDDQEEAYAEDAQRNAAKRAASGISAELLSLQDARTAGGKAGYLGLSASLNPYQDQFPEHGAWENARAAAIRALLRSNAA